MAVDYEVQRLPEITAAWRTASARMQTLLNGEPGAADHAVVEHLAGDVQARLAEIQPDPLFKTWHS
jgi:MoxR-like ATPase